MAFDSVFTWLRVKLVGAAPGKVLRYSGRVGGLPLAEWADPSGSVPDSRLVAGVLAAPLVVLAGQSKVPPIALSDPDDLVGDDLALDRTDLDNVKLVFLTEGVYAVTFKLRVDPALGEEDLTSVEASISLGGMQDATLRVASTPGFVTPIIAAGAAGIPYTSQTYIDRWQADDFLTFAVYAEGGDVDVNFFWVGVVRLA